MGELMEAFWFPQKNYVSLQQSWLKSPPGPGVLLYTAERIIFRTETINYSSPALIYAVHFG